MEGAYICVMIMPNSMTIRHLPQSVSCFEGHTHKHDDTKCASVCEREGEGRGEGESMENIIRRPTLVNKLIGHF
jgi:hypothetical protein